MKQRLNLSPDFPLIIVGGTNGKGSVCAMLESIMAAAGYRVGCYTSPHILNYNERVRIDKQAVSDEALCASFEKIERVRQGLCRNTPLGETELPLALSETSAIALTYFEFGTLAAMQLFIEHKVEIAILEVGLGGRLDAVNVFDADCAIVTCVDIDHTDYLGTTIEEIAFEKAGIFRRDRAAIFADSSVPQAITDHAQKIGAKLFCIGHEYGFKAHQGQWDFYGNERDRTALPMPSLRGAFQLHNASAVLMALEAIRLPVSMDAVRRGLSQVQLSGRFQLVPGRPQLILDVAHNPHAARSLVQNLATLPTCHHTYAVFAMLQDKDIAGVAETMLSCVDTWLVASIDAARGADTTQLSDVLHHLGVKGQIIVFANIAFAISHACQESAENDRIIVFGSFYTVAAAMKARKLRVL
jgi:dihydrofolate synthase/folylpolyglutamate synthase